MVFFSKICRIDVGVLAPGMKCCVLCCYQIFDTCAFCSCAKLYDLVHISSMQGLHASAEQVVWHSCL